jgi:hypothetical protein
LESELARSSEIEEAQPWTAPRVVGNVVVACKATGVLVPPSWRDIIGRHARTLLKDGFPHDVVTAACYMGVLRGRPEVVQYIAGDLMLARTGQRMSTKEYEQKLALYAADHSGARNMLAEQRERMREREAEIDRRRNGETRGS